MAQRLVVGSGTVAERSLPILENAGSNPHIDKILEHFCLLAVQKILFEEKKSR